MSLTQLHRVRWAVRAVLLLGVAASVAANILHARANPVSESIAAWPPLALLLTVELVSRVPVHRKSVAVVRLVSTGAIAGIAAWVSYWHMAAVAARYGEATGSAHLLPFSVDGLVVAASISLVELGGRIRERGEPIRASVVDEPAAPRLAEPPEVVALSDRAADELAEPDKPAEVVALSAKPARGSDLRDKIRAELDANPDATAREISANLGGVPEATVKYHRAAINRQRQESLI
jgi:Protein of unknown function (DUF2637)